MTPKKRRVTANTTKPMGPVAPWKTGNSTFRAKGVGRSAHQGAKTVLQTIKTPGKDVPLVR